MGDLLQHPSAQIISSSFVKERLNMKLETDPALKASKISVTFSAYKAPTGGIETLKLPQKFIFKFRFFTFDEQFTDPLSLANVAKVDEKSVISSGSSYFLQRASSSNAYIHS